MTGVPGKGLAVFGRSAERKTFQVGKRHNNAVNIGRYAVVSRTIYVMFAEEAWIV